MKKILCLMTMFIISLSCLADIVIFKSFWFSFADLNRTTRSFVWGTWEKDNTKIVINDEKENITIYSKIIQVYNVIETSEPEPEGKNITSTKFLCVDKEGNQCILKYVEKNDILQLYIFYSDIAWAYQITRIQ